VPEAVELAGVVVEEDEPGAERARGEDDAPGEEQGQRQDAGGHGPG